MITQRADFGEVQTRERMVEAEIQYERWVHWPVNWSAIWVGSLAAFAVVVLFGLIGLALGAHVLGPENRVVDWKKFGLWTLVFCVFGAFLSFVVGGWSAGRIAGIRRSEPAMLHGAIVWLVATPILIALAGLGAGRFLGGWMGGLAGTPAWAPAAQAPFARPDPLDVTATPQDRAAYQTALAEYRQKVQQWERDTPKVVRNNALGTVTALLLGLVGSVIGGWMASGEPMTFTHYRTRRAGLAAPTPLP
jgi:hypothetical protein